MFNFSFISKWIAENLNWSLVIGCILFLLVWGYAVAIVIHTKIETMKEEEYLYERTIYDINSPSAIVQDTLSIPSDKEVQRNESFTPY